MNRFYLFVVLPIVLASCKNDLEPISVVNAKLLAGDSGQSKSWIFTWGTVKPDRKSVV